jgi:acyl-CoA synthetase (AMP-forming)/AMP-acid ligase II
LIELSDIAAHNLVEQGVHLSRDAGGIVCMLLPTGLDFLITWIALMRMGYGVVLVA